MFTPWGESDYQERLAPGVFSVGTPSHGGILVRGLAASHLSEAAKRRVSRVWRGKVPTYWFEEDCDWAVAVYDLRLESDKREQQRSCLVSWHPTYLLERGETLTPDEEQTIRAHFSSYRETPGLTERERRSLEGCTTPAMIARLERIIAGVPDGKGTVMRTTLAGGNIFSSIADAQRLLREAGRADLIPPLWDRVQAGHSYDAALGAIIAVLAEAGIAVVGARSD